MILVFLNLCFAFEILPQYVSPDEESLRRLMDPSEIGAEYEAAEVSFLFSGSENLSWHRSKAAFQGGAGSISSKEFDSRLRMKWTKDLNEATYFSFYYLQDQNEENLHEANVLELGYRVFPQTFIGLYGNIFYEKKRNDIGFHLSREVWDGLVRFYFASPDFSRNQKNRDNDSFERKPRLYGLSYLQFTAEDFLRFDFRHLSRSEWQVPSDNRSYLNEEFYLLGEKYWQVLGSATSIKLEWLRKYHEQKVLDSPGQNRLRLDKLRLFMDTRIERYRLGFLSAMRRWEDNNEDSMDVFSNHPFVGYRFLQSDRNHAEVLYVLSTMDVEGKADLVSPGSGLEQRLNLSWKYIFSKKNHITLNLGFDLDFTGEPVWEGGNVQFHFFEI